MIFSKVLMRGTVSPTTDLLETGLLDSMGMVDLLFNMEQRFGFTPNFAELDLENFRSIEKIAAMVEVSSPSEGVSV
jgi:acyl carrier protein